jgi:hypothetical protein
VTTGTAGWPSARGRLAAAALYALVALACGVAAYLAIFSQFAPYDDEGTLLVTLRAFAGGDTLYADVYSVYGPFYYELFGGLFALTGLSVTTEVSRTIVIVVWVATSLLYGVAVQRLTSRLTLGAAATIVAFGALYVLIGEPMHPHGLCALLLGAFVLLAVRGPGRRPVWAGGAAGCLLAALLLTKVNLGAFAIVAVVLAAALTQGLPRRLRRLRWAAPAAFLALPVAILARDLSTTWVRELLAIEVLGAVALVLAARPLRPGRDGDADGPLARKWLGGGAIGFAAAFAGILVAIFVTGAGPADVYDGVVVEAVRVRDVLVTPAPLSRFLVVAAALAALFAVPLGRRLATAGPALWPVLLKAAAGVAIWAAVARELPDAFGVAARNPDALPLVLAWIAAMPPAGVDEPAFKRFLRVLLPALGVAGALQVYPVAGSQLGIAAVTFVPAGGLCLADSLFCLRRWSSARGEPAPRRSLWLASATSVALATAFAIVSIAQPAVDNARAYREQQALPFAAADRLHLPAADAATYARLVALLHRHRCTSFIGYPNVNSLYIWSGIDPPAQTPPGAWIEALDNRRQQRVVDALRASPRPCAIRSDSLAGLWLGGEPAPDAPLVRYVLDELEPVAQIGGFEFLTPKPRPEPVR